MIVFANNKTLFDMHYNVHESYKMLFKDAPSYDRTIWYYESDDSARCHSHTPRSQFEDIIVYYRTGEGKHMPSEGTMPGSTSAFHQHDGRTNVLEYYKDDCHSKPFSTVKTFFEKKKREGKHLSTFDYKPESHACAC